MCIVAFIKAGPDHISLELKTWTGSTEWCKLYDTFFVYLNKYIALMSTCMFNILSGANDVWPYIIAFKSHFYHIHKLTQHY